MVAAVAAASVGVFVAVAAAWAAVAVAGCAAADSSSLQDSFSVITDGLYSRQYVSDIWVDVIASTALGCVVQPQVFISNSTKLKLLTIYKYSLNFLISLISLIAVFKKIF